MCIKNHFFSSVKNPNISNNLPQMNISENRANTEKIKFLEVFQKKLKKVLAFLFLA